MKRIAIVLILFCCLPLFAENANIFFPSQRNEKILPNHEILKNLNEQEEEDSVIFLQQALDSSFSYEWVENYLYEGTREALTRVFTNFLETNLPLHKTNYLIGKIINENSMTSIPILIISNNKVVNFLVDLNNSKIVSISFE